MGENLSGDKKLIMEIIIKSYNIGSSVVPLSPGHSYVLRAYPWDENTSIGEEISNSAGYKFSIDNLSEMYKMYDGVNMSSLEENTDFGIKEGNMLIGDSNYYAVPVRPESSRILTKETEGLNPSVHMPVEIAITGDYKINSTNIDLAKSPFNFNFKR